MSKIKVFALGGLGENGKNLYCVDVDNSLFVLDCGIKYPNSELLGIDTVLPDFSFLIENSDRIKGLFLSHAHDDHIGAVKNLLEKIKVKVYGTNFTLDVVKDSLSEELLSQAEKLFHVVTPEDVIKFKNVKISFFATAHSIPETIGINIHTEDGVIVYTGNYTFDQNQDSNYGISYSKLMDLVNKKVLLLMSESLGANKFGNSTNYVEMMYKLKLIFSRAKGRLIFTVFSQDLRRIQKLIDLAVEYDKKVAIVGRKTQRLINIGINNGYLKIPKDILVNLKYIEEKNTNIDDNLVVLVTGTRHEPFYVLQRMCYKKDRLIHINENDEIVILTVPVNGTEKMAAKTIDLLYRLDAKVTVFNRSMLQSSHAFSEEIKLMYNILKPEYAMPIIGEFRHQYAHKNVLKEIKFNEDNLFMLDNGEVIIFEDGKYVGKDESVPAKDIMLDGNLMNDINQVVIKDRENLADDGIFIVACNINARTRVRLNDVQIITKGFVINEKYQELEKLVKEKYDEVLNKYFQKEYLLWNDLKNELRYEIQKIITKTTQYRPVVVAAVIDVDK